MLSPRTDPILNRLLGLHPKSIDLSLGRITALLKRLGHPERQLPPVVHAAGTNGKGSTLAMLEAMLRADGRSVQRYVSPHLVRFHERILFDGEPIDEEFLAELLLSCERINDGRPITFWEITTAAAFLAFKERPADILLLETGLGGRLDGTNVIDNPLAVGLTSIAYDHERYLGKSIIQIAREKCGIIKPGTTVVSAVQSPGVATCIQQMALRRGARLSLGGRDWTMTATDGAMAFRDDTTQWRLPMPALPGRHQIVNAGTAVALARNLGPLAPDKDAIASGLQAVEWAGRLQRVSDGPLRHLVRDGDELWLDGGHNPSAGEVLATFFKGLPPKNLRIIIGMLEVKDAHGFLAPLAPLVDQAFTVEIPGERSSMDARALAGRAGELGINATPCPSIPAALAEASQGADARIAILGSLYLIGHVLSLNGRSDFSAE
ncbi:MAG: bifunctional folylpolyglutamate synthase/dihydrofolate synthase [Geminicoccaceae bacterium]